MSGYHSSDIDGGKTNLDDVFDVIGVNPKVADVGFEVDDVDVSNRWLDVDLGRRGPPVLKYATSGNYPPNTDVGDIFATSPSRWGIYPLFISTKSGFWTGTLTHEFTITHDPSGESWDTMSNFFNLYSGEIRFSAALTPSTDESGDGRNNNDAQNASMVALLDRVNYAYDKIEYQSTTETFVEVYNIVGNGTYAEDQYRISVKKSGETVTFRVEITETDDDHNPAAPDGGTLNATVGDSTRSIIDVYRNVDLLQPQYSELSVLVQGRIMKDRSSDED